jgi:hypothetical protein
MSKVIDLVPTMTSNNTPSGIVTASGYYQTYYPYKAFDKKIIDIRNDIWIGRYPKVLPEYLQYKFDEPVCVNKYSIQEIPYDPNYYADNFWRTGANVGSFVLLGSNDGVNFIELDSEIISQDYWKSNSIFEKRIENINQYLYYRIRIDSTANLNGGYVQIGELNLSYEEQFRYLIKQDDNYYSIQNNVLTLLGTPTDDTQKEQWFNDYGIYDLREALLTLDENGKKLIDSLEDKFEVRMMVQKD